MAGFGFAAPIQHRLPIMGMNAMTAAPAPAVMPMNGGVSGDQIKSGLQRLGLLRPTAPGMNLPSITSPSMPTGTGLDDPSAAIKTGVDNVVAGGGDAMAGAGDAAAADSPGIGDFLAALFGG